MKIAVYGRHTRGILGRPAVAVHGGQADGQEDGQEEEETEEEEDNWKRNLTTPTPDGWGTICAFRIVFPAIFKDTKRKMKTR